LDHGPEEPRIGTSKNRRRQQIHVDFEWWLFDTRGQRRQWNLLKVIAVQLQVKSHITLVLRCRKRRRQFEWTNGLSCRYEHNKPELCINRNRSRRHKRWLLRYPSEDYNVIHSSENDVNVMVDTNVSTTFNLYTSQPPKVVYLNSELMKLNIAKQNLNLICPY